MANDAAVYLHVDGFDGFDKSIDFDKKQIRRAMTLTGRLMQKGAQKRVNSSARSQPGQYPGRRKGILRKSIKFKVSRSGFLVRIAPQKIPGMAQFYPAFLNYGVKRKKSGSLRVQPRGNYMVDELADRNSEIQNILASAFGKALVIR